MAPGFDFSPENLNREFPVRNSLVYFNHAAVAPLPRRVAGAIAAHNENVRDRGAADWRRWYAAIEEAREKVARFLGASREEVAFLPNTSWGLNLVAQAFPWKEGDNVVSDDMEFPSNAYPWLALEKRGVERRLAANRGGRGGGHAGGAEEDTRTPGRAAEAGASGSTRSRRRWTRARASSRSPGSPSTTAGFTRSRRSRGSAAS